VTDSTPAIELRHATKRYGDTVALDGVSMEIDPGEFFCLLGPSGCGKTTTLNLIGGFIPLTSGELRIEGRTVNDLPPHRRNVNTVFQNYALFPHMTVGENVAYPLRLRGVARVEREERARRALATVQMAAYAERRIDQLSGGQRQRVAVARAMVFEPNIILMDEPLSALDKRLREEMQVELKHLHDRLGRTTVYVTHDQKEALTMSDRVAVLKAGRIRQIASPRDIYDRPVDHFVADFIGDSAFLPLNGADGMIDLNVSDGFRSAHLAQHRDPLLLLRPEKIEIAGGTDRRPGFIYFDGTAEEILFQGNLMLVFTKLVDGTRLHLERGTRLSTVKDLPRIGERFRMAVHEADAWIVPAEGAP
jgi:putative spermidine/putrescine transport system ATP-binding protein